MAEAKTWLKWGCFGCLAVVGALVFAVVGVVAIVSLQARSEKVDTRELTHGLPAAEQAPAPPAASGAGAAVPLRPPAGAAGRVVLRLSHAAFFLERGAPGEPLRVKARYDTKSYELQEEWQTPAGSPWSYSLGFRSRSGSILRVLREMLGGTAPEIRLFLPPDAPIALDLELGQAGSEVELGGLWLTEADIEINQGGLQLGVSEPVHAPLERLSIRAAMAGVEAVSLGNASPRKLDLEASMGGVEFDLRGAWIADSAISIAARMGGVEVTLPRDVNVVGADSGRLSAGPEPELKRPTLTFDVKAEMGGVEFRNR